ncbi:MAG: CBS domain-containing protein, partial [Metallosphaera sp.]
AVAISYLVSGNYTIYRSQVPTRRDSPAHKSEYEIPVMQRLKVGQCKRYDIRVSPSTTVEVALKLMLDNNFLSLPVVDESSRFIGIVYYRDIEGKNPLDQVGRYVMRGSPHVSPQSSLEQAWEIMALNRSRWVAVVDKGIFQGMVTMDSLLALYEHEVRALTDTSRDT